MKFEDRYSRQILFPGIGREGQVRLSQGRVAIVGCGATGACVAGLLARAGVGHLLIIDRDYVEPSNLQRQSLFDEADAAESIPKAIAAVRKIAAFNSDVQAKAEVADLTPENIAALLSEADLILDATDNFETRYLINDFAIKHGKPWIYAAAVAAGTQTAQLPLHHSPPRRTGLFLPTIEKETILKALEEAQGDRARAAQMLGIGRTTLYRKLKEYKIEN